MKTLKSLGWIALLAGLMACGGDSKTVAGPEGNDSDDSLTGDGSLVADRVDDQKGSDGVPSDPSLVDPGFVDPQIVNTADLVELLDASGLSVEQMGELVEQPFFTPDAQILKFGGQDLQVFEYETVEALKSEAREVSPDGSLIGTTMVMWVAPVRFYARGNLIILYVGQDEAVLDALDQTLGGAFAGAGTLLPIDDLPVYDPAIVVASTGTDLRQLVSLIQDPELSDRLAGVDIETNVVIAVFRGEMLTAGYGIEIEEVRPFDDFVEVTVSFTDPGIDALVAQVITYPVAVRVVSRSDLPEVNDVDWIAVTPEGEGFAKFRAGVTGGGASVGSGASVIDGTPGAEPGVITVDPNDVDAQDDLDDPEEEGPAPPITLRDADIRGTIATYQDNGAADVLAQILIEGEIESDTDFDKALVRITDDTRIVRISANDAYTEASREDLVPGTRVHVLFTGPIAESYPVQVAALHVVILE